MADDIDIEEHDVLDSPAIRSIFPDISIIKKEISQYYEDAPNIKLEPDILNEKSFKNQTESSSANETCFKDIHEESSEQLFPLKDIVVGCDYDMHNLEKTAVQGSKIIQESKSNETIQQITDIHKVQKTSVKSLVPVPKIIIQDLGAYIYNNNKYCKVCRILFTSRLDCDDHNGKVHSIEARRKQINVKVILELNSNECNICGSHFTNSGNLSRHYKNVHRKKKPFKAIFNSNRVVKHTQKLFPVASTNSSSQVMSNKIRSSQSKDTSHKAKNECFHCKKLFSDHESLIEHIYQVLEPKRYTKEKPCKKLDSIRENYETNTKKPEEEPTNSTIYGNQNKFVSKKIRDKLTFENQDKDESESQILNTKRDILLSQTKTRQKVNVTVSTSYQPKAILDHKNINDRNQVVEACCSKTLRIKRKHEDQVDASRSIKTDKNILSGVSKSLDKKQKHEIGYKQSNEFSILSSETKNKNKDFYECMGLNNKPDIKNENLESREPKTLKIIPAKEKKNLLSMNTGNDIIEDTLQSYESGKNRLIYECRYCSFALPTAKAYHIHVLRKHKVEKILRPTQVIFVEKCKFCPNKCKTYNDRNTHVYLYHRELLNRHIPREPSYRVKNNTKSIITALEMFKSFVLESIIYKCNECGINFLSSCIAKDHEKHTKVLKNWECVICRRMFKHRDRHLHVKQHKSSETLKTCQFNQLELSRLLYSCTKCAVHFTEEGYLEHYSKCGSTTSDSKYCKVCDILIDKRGYINHETYHRKGINTADFNIIMADLITKPTTDCTKIENIEKRKKNREFVNCLTFCQTCKCYLNDMGYTHKIHIESRCSNKKKFICKLCGLVIASRSADSHKKYHKKQKYLKLQDFMFFDLEGTQISHPIPEYPCCDNCNVSFVSKQAVSNHICNELEYLTCNICNIKLSENAYKLHMDFHDYYQLKANKDTFKAYVASELYQQKIDTNEDKINPCSNPAINCKYSDAITVDDKIGYNDNPMSKIVYSCHYCMIAVNTYDKVIEHCQNHFSPIPTISSKLIICSKCSLKFEAEGYEIHQKLHLHDATQLLTFDPTYFTSDNSKWIQHIFSSTPQTIQKEIVSKSIYRDECRIRMEIVQKGPIYLTVYKCSKCGNFVDPDCLLAHVKDTCSNNVIKYPCSVCGLPFLANVFRSKHEKVHKQYDSVCLKSYNIVLIKCEAHNCHNTSIINAIGQYVLYQCRACDGIVDKLQRNFHQCDVDDLQKCSICNLLLYTNEYERHLSKHIDLAMFNGENMKVILFGKDEVNLKKVLSPSFIGVIHDYKLYKCAKCDVCVNNEISISRHVCTFDNSKWKCPKCSFYICTSLALKNHIKMHDEHSEFISENIKIVIFGTNEIISNKTNTEIYSSRGENNITKENERKSNAAYKNTDNDLETVSLYKCACGLHYIDKLNASHHVANCSIKIKVIRQTCSKCSLVFNPRELFSHIIAHHGDKNKIYKFIITEISAKN